MRVRRLTADYDYAFGASAKDYIADLPETVGQIVGTSLRLWLGEWYYDTSLGMPWIEGVLGKHNQSTADVTVQDFILNITGVVGIPSYTSADFRDVRKYAANATIDTIYGPTPVDIANQRLF